MLNTDNRNKLNSTILLFITALLWSTGGVLIKLISIDPVAISGFRSLFAAIVFLPFVGNPLKIKLNKLKFFCALCYASNVISVVVATKYTTSANAILLQYTAPIYVTLLSGKILGVKGKRSDYYTVFGVLIGMIIFVYDGLTNKNFIGNVLGMASGVFFAAVILLTKKIHMSSSTISSFEPLFLGNVLTALLCSPFYFNQSMGANDIWMLLALGIFQLGIPYVLYAYGTRYVTAIQTSLITTLEPILNPVWVFLVTKELPSLLSLIGGLIVIISLSANYIILGIKQKKDQLKLPIRTDI